MLPCLEKVYQMVLQTQLQFIDSDPILTIKIQSPFKAVLKKEFLHIYKDDEPFDSMPLCFPNLIKWHLQDNRIIGFTIHEQEYISNQTAVLEELHVKLAGRVFFSKVQDFYQPLKLLGKGSSSKVLLAREKKTSLLYAIKCVEKEEMQIQEIFINNQLQHQAFIRVKEVYQGETSYYIIMDLLAGKNLQSVLSYHQPLPLEQTKSIMHALLEGVEHMHSKNIMHRDIKPENIILEEKNGQMRLKIVDFGLATYSTLKRFKYPKCGTPGFVAPEVVNLVNSNQTYDKVCDIFSCGVIFYKLLSGRDVFPGNGFNYVLQMNKKCNIDFTHLTVLKLPNNVTNLVQRMLSRDPKLRPSATECLSNEFFKNIEKYNSAQKKQGFQSAKLHTVELNQDKEIQDYHGSFITTDKIQSQIVPKQKMMQKFNTQQFDNIV